MLNQVVEVGRIKEIKDNTLKIGVSSSFKNTKGEYETYFITVFMNGSVAKNVMEYCHRGDLVGIKGHLESGNKLVAEKITFLSTKQDK